MESVLMIHLDLDIYTVIIANITSIETLNSLRRTCRWFRDYLTKRRMLDVVITNILHNEDYDPSATVLKRPLTIRPDLGPVRHQMQLGDVDFIRYLTKSYRADTVNDYVNFLSDKLDTHDCFFAIERTLISNGDPSIVPPTFGNRQPRPFARTFATSMQPIGNVSRRSIAIIGDIFPGYGRSYEHGYKSFESNFDMEEFLMSGFDEFETYVNSCDHFGYYACSALCENRKNEYMDRLDIQTKDFNYRNCTIPQNGPNAFGFEDLEDEDLINFRYIVCFPSFFLRGYVNMLPTTVNDRWLTNIRLICIEKNPGPFASMPVQSQEVKPNLLPSKSKRTDSYSVVNNRIGKASESDIDMVNEWAKKEDKVQYKDLTTKSDDSKITEDSSLKDKNEKSVDSAVRYRRSRDRPTSRDEVKTSNNKYHRDKPMRNEVRENQRRVDSRHEYRPRYCKTCTTNDVVKNSSSLAIKSDATPEPAKGAVTTNASQSILDSEMEVPTAPPANDDAVTAEVQPSIPDGKTEVPTAPPVSVESKDTVPSSVALSSGPKLDCPDVAAATTSLTPSSSSAAVSGLTSTNSSSTSPANATSTQKSTAPVKTSTSAAILATVTQPAVAKVDVLKPLPDSGPKVVIDIKDPEATALLALAGIKELVNDLHIQLYNVPSYEVHWIILRYTLLILFIALELDLFSRIFVCVFSAAARTHVLDFIMYLIGLPIVLAIHYYVMKVIPHKHLVYSAKLVSLRVSENLQKEYFKTGKEIPDLRPDAISQTKLKHQELIDAVFLYTQHGWNSFFCFSYVMNSRRLDVSLEAFVQIAHAKNLSLMLNDKDAWYSFYHSAQSTQTINLDKNQVLQNKLVIQDTCIIADLKYREMHQRRGWMAFPKPV
jgi:hypothetical protein